MPKDEVIERFLASFADDEAALLRRDWEQHGTIVVHAGKRVDPAPVLLGPSRLPPPPRQDPAASTHSPHRGD